MCGMASNPRGRACVAPRALVLQSHLRIHVGSHRLPNIRLQRHKSSKQVASDTTACWQRVLYRPRSLDAVFRCDALVLSMLPAQPLKIVPAGYKNKASNFSSPSQPYATGCSLLPRLRSPASYVRALTPSVAPASCMMYPSTSPAGTAWAMSSCFIA